MADRLIVMHVGQTAEGGPVEDLLASPMHSCTQLLRTARCELGGPPLAAGA
jgi:ABC-type glutathione transport system ATPase component